MEKENKELRKENKEIKKEKVLAIRNLNICFKFHTIL